MPEATELTLSLNLDALLLTKLPILLPHPENPPDARAPALFSVDVTFVEAADWMDATEAKLNGRSFRSPPPAPVAAMTDAGKEDGGGGGELTASCAGGVVVLEPENGLLKVGKAIPPIPPEACLCATILLTFPRTPPTALKKLVEPAVMALLMASRVGASC